MKDKTIPVWILFVVFLFMSSSSVVGRSISPFVFGFADAKSGEKRFDVLYRTHLEAIRTGVDVDYTGIGRVDLVISSSAKSIPLTTKTDFKNAEFHVLNKQKDFHLFTLLGNAESIQIEKKKLGRSRQKIDVLKGKNVILSISDGNPWVENRRGYNYGATRSDIIVVKNGVMQNVPIMPYDNESSSPVCSSYPLTPQKKEFKNISFFRASESTFKTYFLKIDGQFNVQISNVSIFTPDSQLYGDAAIKVSNCAKVLFCDVNINGTYSGEKTFGYGIAMNNVFDVTFRRLNAHGKWGVFGTNNVQKVSLIECDINRFDIHCYGRDVTCEKTVFRNQYNQFSSVYGTIRFHRCSFVEFIPVLIEYSYNAYTGFDLIVDKCLFRVSEKKGKNNILSIGYLDEIENTRPELQEKCWPNVYINDLTIDAPLGIKEVFLMKLNQPVTSRKPIGYATSFKLNRITYMGDNAPELVISNYDIPVENSIYVSQRQASRSPIIIRDNITVVN